MFGHEDTTLKNFSLFLIPGLIATLGLVAIFSGITCLFVTRRRQKRHPIISIIMEENNCQNTEISEHHHLNTSSPAKEHYRRVLPHKLLEHLNTRNESPSMLHWVSESPMEREPLLDPPQNYFSSPLFLDDCDEFSAFEWDYFETPPPSKPWSNQNNGHLKPNTVNRSAVSVMSNTPLFTELSFNDAKVISEQCGDASSIEQLFNRGQTITLSNQQRRLPKKVNNKSSMPSRTFTKRALEKFCLSKSQMREYASLAGQDSGFHDLASDDSVVSVKSNIPQKTKTNQLNGGSVSSLSLSSGYSESPSDTLTLHKAMERDYKAYLQLTFDD